MKSKHLTMTELAEFFEEYFLLRQAGENSRQVAETMLAYQDNRSIQRILSSLSAVKNLSSGLSEFSSQIPEYIIALLQKSETEGTEIETLAAISTHLNSMAAIDEDMPYRHKLRLSLFYPLVILLICFMLVFLLMIFVVPLFEELFYGFGAELPAFTQMFISASAVLQKSYLPIVATIIVIFIYLRLPLSQSLRSRMILMLPSIGDVGRETETAFVINALHLLLSHDFRLPEALRLSAGATQNTVIAEALLKGSEAASKNLPFVEALAKANVFSPRTLHLLTIFDRSLHLDLLQNLVRQIGRKLARQGKTSLRSVSIALLILCWLIVGSAIIAMYLPIFQLGSAVG